MDDNEQSANMPGSTILKASCLCGHCAHEISIASSALPLQTTLCHCDSCRHMTGTLSFGCTRLPDTYQPRTDFVESLTAFRFSEKITQYNCPTCGAFVLSSSKLSRVDGRSQKLHWDVMTGTLEDYDKAIQLRGHIYVEDTKDGGFADLLTTWRNKTLRRWSRYDDRDDEKPLGWRSVPVNAGQNVEKLHAYCKCGGVQFYIQRPAKGSNDGRPRPIPTSSGDICSPELCAWVRNDRGMFLASHCLCNSCRKATGMDVTQYAVVKTSDITLDEAGMQPWEPVFGTLKAYKSSPGRTRTFCSVCGAMAFFINDTHETDIDVGVGLFDASEGARAESWIEWRLERIGYPDDASGRADSLVEAMVTGFKQCRQDSDAS